MSLSGERALEGGKTGTTPPPVERPPDQYMSISAQPSASIASPSVMGSEDHGGVIKKPRVSPL